METAKFNIQNVAFTIEDACKIFKRKKEYSLDYILENFFPPVYITEMEVFKKTWDSVEPITHEEALKFENAEQRRVAIAAFDFSEFLSHFNHQILDTQTITKKNRRWRVSTSGELEEYEHVFEDTYTLVEIDLKNLYELTRSANANLKFQGVKCSCTTTGRSYFLWRIPNTSWSSKRYDNNDAISAICSTLRVGVKEEAVKAFRRQGDVILTIVKPEFKNSYKCPKRPISREEYINKLESET